MNDIHNVQTSSLADGHGLYYNASSGKFINSAPSCPLWVDGAGEIYYVDKAVRVDGSSTKGLLISEYCRIIGNSYQMSFQMRTSPTGSWTTFMAINRMANEVRAADFRLVEY